MGKPTNCIGKNKGADLLHSYRKADQRLCFRQSILFLNSKFQASVTVQAGLYRSWLEPKLLVFSCTVSYQVSSAVLLLFTKPRHLMYIDTLKEIKQYMILCDTTEHVQS